MKYVRVTIEENYLDNKELETLKSDLFQSARLYMKMNKSLPKKTLKQLRGLNIENLYERFLSEVTMDMVSAQNLKRLDMVEADYLQFEYGPLRQFFEFTIRNLRFSFIVSKRVWSSRSFEVYLQIAAEDVEDYVINAIKNATS